MKQRSRRQLAEGFVRILTKRPHNEAVKALAHAIMAERRVAEVDSISQEIEKVLLKQESRVHATVTVARPLAADFHPAVTHLVQKLTGAKQVTLSETIDPTILGGIIIRTPEHEIDLSLKKQLHQLEAV